VPACCRVYLAVRPWGATARVVIRARFVRLTLKTREHLSDSHVGEVQENFRPCASRRSRLRCRGRGLFWRGASRSPPVQRASLQTCAFEPGLYPRMFYARQPPTMPARHVVESFFDSRSEENGEQETHRTSQPRSSVSPPLAGDAESRGGGANAGAPLSGYAPEQLRLAIRQLSMSVPGQRGGVRCNLFLPRKPKG
jgi:hypothetical protein